MKSSALALIAFGTAAAAAVIDHPDYASLARMSVEELAVYERGIKVVGAQPLPPPINDTSFKLVYDRLHPYRKAGKNDQRGPCPGLNTLASHGYLPRDGVATPAQIIEAVQTGFNMEYQLAVIVTYGAFLVDGNHLTNLMSIGGADKRTGDSPPAPALAGGLNVHGTFEGDASTTRSDDFLGDNHNLNMTLFNQLIDTMNSHGNGSYNIHSAAEFRYQRIVHSIANNPTFDLGNPRFATAYAETTFPLEFFSNASTPDWEVGTSAANIRSFFLEHKFPENFHRRGSPFSVGGDILDALLAPHPMFPGTNDGVNVNTFQPIDFNGGETETFCAIYNKFIEKTVALYPNPTGNLRKAVAQNLKNFYETLKNDCTEKFPYA